MSILGFDTAGNHLYESYLVMQPIQEFTLEGVLDILIKFIKGNFSILGE